MSACAGADSAPNPVPPTTVTTGSSTSPVLTLTDPVYRIEHVALLLGCSVDRAREYTYLPDFPVPFQPGSRLLWLQAEVLGWLTGQPRKTDRSRTAVSAPTAPAQPVRRYQPRPRKTAA